MQGSVAAAVCTLALLLFVLPATISASDGTEDAYGGPDRQLLVVKENATDAMSNNNSQPASGSAASSVGADFNPPELASKTAAPTTPEGTQEVAPALPAQQQARSQRQRQQQRASAQQQRALGRKAGPQLRQSAAAGGGGGGGGGGTSGGTGGGDGGAGAGAPPEVFVGSLDDYVLPFCQPTAGVVCSDRDKTALLKAEPAVISLENAYPYAQVKPAASYAGSSVTTVDFPADTISNKNQGVTKSALETLAGTEAVNADTTVTSTALQSTIDGSRSDRVIPDAVSVVADRTAAEGTYERKSWRPRFTYQIGANYGLPVGLATVTDTNGK